MIGVEIYGYRVERAMSEDKGGFGEVYFARHTTSGAEAVIKVLKPEMSAHREIVTRFFNEARAAASIKHPGIVAVHNVGYVHDRAYLMMERLEGEDLETRLRRGPLPVDVALRFLRQAAGAIGAAHERGIVHRDLKPANLFVVPDPDVVGGERIKVLDFGIAKLGTGGTMKTQGVFGTPAYMSPEQCSSAGEVDARSDLYSLGCILCELISGRPPFGNGGVELIASHLRDEPPPLRTIAPSAPAVVEALVEKLLRKPRDARPASCAALIAALDDAARAITSVPTPLPTRITTSPPQEPAMLSPTLQPATTTLGSAIGVAKLTTAKRMPLWFWLGALGVIAAVTITVLAIHGSGFRASSPIGIDAPLVASEPSSATTTIPLGFTGAIANLDSSEILARQPQPGEVLVKHVLIGWKDLAGVYHGHIDGRAAARSSADAAELAEDVARQLRADPSQIDALVTQYSEDPGSLAGDPYAVTSDSQFLPEFKNLALRLEVNEVGIVGTQLGYSVVERVAPPPLDPLESADILSRTPNSGTVFVQHIMVGWNDTPAVKSGHADPRALARSKADADQLAQKIFGQAATGADFKRLMRTYSEDPGSKDDGKAYPVSADSTFVEPFKKLSLRLAVGEVGMVISPFGWHVIKRVRSADLR